MVNFKLLAKNPDNPSQGQVLDSFSIGRTVHQNKQSKYYLNGRTADFKDIQRKLKNAGVDLDHNRFLILQVSYRNIV